MSNTHSSPQPPPQLDSHFINVDHICDNNAAAGSAGSVHAYPYLRNLVSQADFSNPSKSPDRRNSSSREDILRELQDRSQVVLGYESMLALHKQSLKQCSSVDFSLPQYKSTATLASLGESKGPRRLLKMASTPAFRGKEDRRLLRVNRRGEGIGNAALNRPSYTLQIQPPSSSKSFIDVPVVTARTMEAKVDVAKGRQYTKPRWPRSWRIFRP